MGLGVDEQVDGIAPDQRGAGTAAEGLFGEKAVEEAMTVADIHAGECSRPPGCHALALKSPP